MTRGTVIRLGDGDFTGAIMDGMAAARLQRENEALKMREAHWMIHDRSWRRGIMYKIRRARKRYGHNPVRSRIADVLLGFYGLIVWLIDFLYQLLKAKNREVAS